MMASKSQQKNQVFEESDLVFHFNQDWVVRKYDEHRFYKTISGLGMKGVDFIGIFKAEQVVFIEIKNYRIRYEGKTLQPLYDVFDAPGNLAKKMQQKFTDSTNGVLVINNFLGRKWWSNIIMPLLKKIPFSRWSKNDLLFWIRCQELIQKGHFKNVLFLETDDSYPDYTRDKIQFFRKELNHKLVGSVLADTREHPFSGSWWIELNDK